MKKGYTLLFGLIAFALVLLLPGTALAAVLRVDQGATGANNGSSWTDAYTDLQTALTSAADAPGADEIWVAAGTYKPTAGTDRTVAFTLNTDVALYGGFSGTETSRDQRDWETNVTILSGEIGDPDDPSDNSYHVVRCAGHYLWPGLTAVLDGFTVTGGMADKTSFSDPDSSGGGMYNYLSSPLVQNCVFSENFATFGGGMANRTSSSPVLANVSFVGNEALIQGGGMLNASQSSPMLTDVTFDGNTTQIAGGGGGAGMFNHYLCSPSLTRVSFLNNSSYGGAVGGGLYAQVECSLSLTDVKFENNWAGYGGGMGLSEQSVAVLKRVEFSENTAESSGGALYNWSGSNLDITDAIFDGNSSTYYGGAVYMYLGSATITNAIFSNNSAVASSIWEGEGGAVYNYLCDPVTFTNVSFAGNVASYSGAALQNVSSSPTLVNCILWGNSTTNKTAQIYEEYTAASNVSFSIVQDGWTGLGSNNLDEDPLFMNVVNGDLRLQAGSPAIDAGTNSASGLPSTDIGGNPRIVDGDDDGTATVDMGAYEFIADTTAPSLTPPADKTAEATGPDGAEVAWEAATATDDVDGILPADAIHYYISYGTPDQAEIHFGHLFPVGVTTVTCAATDAAGNTATATFRVTITDTGTPQVDQLVVSPTRPDFGEPVTVRVVATDTVGPIALVEYRLGGGPWMPMTPDDGNFDSPTEAASVTLVGLAKGLYDVYVRATDGSPTPNVSAGLDSVSFRVGSVPLPTFTLLYVAGEGGAISGAAQQEVGWARSGTPVTAVPFEGYAFAGWSDGHTVATRTDGLIRHDLTVTAEFRVIVPPPPPPPIDRWSDITDQEWLDYYGVTADAAARVAEGYLDGTFGPFLAVSRAQFAKMVLTGLGLPPYLPGTAAYADVPVSHGFFSWVEGARAQGLITGYLDGTFRPDALITRQQAYGIVGRYLAAQELGRSGHIQGSLGTYASLEAWYAAEGESILAGFEDRATLASVHAPTTAYLVYRGVVLGSADQNKLYLYPLADLSRAQAVALILRVDALD